MLLCMAMRRVVIGRKFPLKFIHVPVRADATSLNLSSRENGAHEPVPAADPPKQSAGYLCISSPHMPREKWWFATDCFTKTSGIVLLERGCDVRNYWVAPTGADRSPAQDRGGTRVGASDSLSRC